MTFYRVFYSNASFPMNRLILAGLMAALVAGCTSQPTTPPSSESPSVPTETQSPTSTPTEADDTSATPNQYRNEVYGFTIAYPEGYVISGKPPYEGADPTAKEQIELWQQEDLETIQDRMDELTELPPNITIQVYDQVADRPLSSWKYELSHDDARTIAMDGQEAIAYSSTGLYEQDNVLVGTPDGKYVLQFSVGYFDAESPMRDDFQAIVQSLSFE